MALQDFSEFIDNFWCLVPLVLLLLLPTPLQAELLHVGLNFLHGHFELLDSDLRGSRKVESCLSKLWLILF